MLLCGSDSLARLWVELRVRVNSIAGVVGSVVIGILSLQKVKCECERVRLLLHKQPRKQQ